VNRERSAIDAVAKWFSATWEPSSDATVAYLLIGRKRVAVHIAALKLRGTGRGRAARPRLRFDKVATRLVERLRDAFDETVPDGMTVLLTITAPIRMPAKTVASLKEYVRFLLGRRSPGRDTQDVIHGNRVRIRLLRNVSDRAPKLIGFVHNPDSDPVLLLNLTSGLLEVFSADVGRAATRLASERWLVVISAGQSSALDAYRYIVSQLHATSGFKKILMVFEDGSVGILKG